MAAVGRAGPERCRRCPRPASWAPGAMWPAYKARGENGEWRKTPERESGSALFFFFFNESVSCRLVARMGGQGKEEPFSGSNFAEVARVPQLRACRAPQRSLLTTPAACPSAPPGPAGGRRGEPGLPSAKAAPRGPALLENNPKSCGFALICS